MGWIILNYIISSIAIGLLFHARHAFTNTTLISAYRWALTALLIWTAATTCEGFLPNKLIHLKEQIWYYSAIFLICPFISVLGARSPTHRVWNLFIILPLILVLAWPAMTVIGEFPKIGTLRIQSPVLIGFVVAIVMGVGNYLATRFWLGALLAAIPIIPALIPLTTWCPANWPKDLIHWTSPLVGLAVIEAYRQAIRPIATKSPEDRLWIEFRETFGLVWSARIQEQVNTTAHAESWPVKLGADGLAWDENTSDQLRQNTLIKVHKRFRWLLRRFVEPIWIDAIIGSDQTSLKNEPPNSQHHA